MPVDLPPLASLWIPGKPAIIRAASIDEIARTAHKGILPGIIPIMCFPQPLGGNDAFTKLLLHCDGSDGATTFTDVSASGHAITARGNAQVDTAQSVFGGASALFDGSGDGLNLANSADWNLGPVGGGNDFTIDFRVRYNAAPSAGVTRLISAEAGAGWLIYHAAAGIALWTAAGPTQTAWTWAPSTATWYHCALVRTGTTFKFFVDGTSLGDGAERDMNNNGSALAIGISDAGTGSVGPFNGWMDEIRISKGIARWTANFTPPAVAYS